MAAVKVSVVALEQSGIGSVAVGPARLPDSGVASTAAQIPACLENRAIPAAPAGAVPLVLVHDCRREIQLDDPFCLSTDAGEGPAHGFVPFSCATVPLFGTAL
jgi:hypothetical protein